MATGTVAVDAYNSIAATADRAGQVRLYDVSAADHPALLSRVTIPRQLSGIALAGESMLVAGQGGIEILDISNPRSPVFRANVEFGGEATTVKAAGNLGYAAFGNALVLLDIATGKILDRHVYSSMPIDDLALSGDSLYLLASESGSAEFQITKLRVDSSLGNAVSTWKSAESGSRAEGPMSLFAGGNLVYVGSVAQGESDRIPGIEIIEDNGSSFTVKGAPAPIGAETMRPTGLGLLAYVGALREGQAAGLLGVLDISNQSSTDKILRRFDLTGPAYGVTLYRGYAYVAAGEAGLKVVRFAAPNGSYELPSIALDSSSLPETNFQGDLIRLTADVKATDQIRKVDFYLNGEKVASDGDYPFEYRFFSTNLSEGESMLVSACAEDLDGNTSCTKPREINPKTNSDLKVISVTPASGASTGHSSSLSISARFSSPLNAATVKLQNVALARISKSSTSPAAIALASVSYQTGSNSIVLQPKSPLSTGTYQVTLSAALRGANGSALPADYSWSFNVAPATITWSSPLSGSWTVATNWSGGAVPANGDNVVINNAPGVTVTLSSSSPQIQNLTVGAGNQLTISGGNLAVVGTGSAVTLNLLGGSLGGPGTVTVSGAMDWAGGGITGTLDIPAKAVLTINTPNVLPNTFYLNGGTINNSGTVNHSWVGSGYGLYILGGGTINNLAGGTWNLLSDVAIAPGDNSATAFNNTGTFNKIGGTGASNWYLSYGGAGALKVQAGTLNLLGTYARTLSGPIAVNSNAILNYGQGGTLSGGTVTGSGTMNFTASASVSGAYSFTGLTQILAGTVAFNNATSFTSLNLSGGALAGAGPVTINGIMDWTGGGITGIVNIPVKSILTINTPNALPNTFYLSGGTINNSGTVNHSWVGAGYGLYLLNGGTINNLAGATWNVTSDVAISVSDSSANAFNNAGTFNKVGGANTSNWGVPFGGAGPVNLKSGTLNLTGTFTRTLSGPIAISAAAALNYGQGGTLAGALVTGSGTLNFTASTAVSGTYSFAGLTQIQAGTVAFAGPTTISTLNLIGGVLAGPGLVTISGSMNWTGGGITGIVDIPVKSVLTIKTPNVLPNTFYLSGGTINNSGTVNHSWGGAGYGLYLTKGAVINNLAGATWNAISDVTVAVGDASANAFNNTGTFNKSGGANVSNWSVPFGGSGAINILSGDLNLTGNFTGTMTAPISIASKAILDYGQGGTLDGGTVTGTGTLNFDASTRIIGTYAFAGTTQIQSGSSAVSFNGATTISSLNLISGVLAGPGIVTIGGTMNWTGGGITGTLNIPVSSVLTIKTPNVLPNTFYLSGGTINNSGTVNHSWNGAGYGLYLTKGSVINNLAGATWNAISDVAVAVGDSSAIAFNNTGTFNKIGGTNTSTWSVPFGGSGAINIQSGDLSLTGVYTGTLTAPIAINAKAILDYGQGGTLDGGKVTGSGTLNFNASTSVSGTYTFAGLTQIQSGNGTVTFNGSTTIASLNLTSGVLGGEGPVNISGNMDWTGGGITGVLNIQTKAIMAINTPNVLPNTFYISGGTINNSGTVNHSWNGAGYGLYLLKGAVINNLAGAAWNVISDVIVAAGDSSAVAFNNAGTFTKSGGPGTSNWTVCLSGSGALNVTSGTTSLGAFCPSSNLSGAIAIGASATLSYGQEGSLSGGSLTGAGNLKLTTSANGANSASTNLAGVNTISVKTTILGGTVNVAGTATFDNLDITAGTVQGIGAFKVTGTLNLSGGSVSVTGSTTIGSLNLSATGSVSGTGSVDVTGTMKWSGGSVTGSGSFDIQNLSLSSSSSVSMQLGGRILSVSAEVDLSGDITFTLAPGTNPAVGTAFQVLSFANAYTGLFSNIGLPTLGNGDTLSEDLTSSGLTFTVTKPA